MKRLFAWLILLVAWSVQAADGPVIPRGQGDACVADTDLMRTDHMDFIMHQRDQTVIEGIRDEPFALYECVNCHAQKDDQGKALRVDAEGQFCQSCHSYAAVKIDCFSCHAAVPDTMPAPHMPQTTGFLHEGSRSNDESTALTILRLAMQRHELQNAETPQQ